MSNNTFSYKTNNYFSILYLKVLLNVITVYRKTLNVNSGKKWPQRERIGTQKKTCSKYFLHYYPIKKKKM